MMLTATNTTMIPLPECMRGAIYEMLEGTKEYRRKALMKQIEETLMPKRLLQNRVAELASYLDTLCACGAVESYSIFMIDHDTDRMITPSRHYVMRFRIIWASNLGPATLAVMVDNNRMDGVIMTTGYFNMSDEQLTSIGLPPGARYTIPVMHHSMEEFIRDLTLMVEFLLQ